MNRNNEIITNLFINPPLIRSSLIDVSDQKRDKNLLNKLMKNESYKVMIEYSLLNDLRNETTVQLSQTNEFDQVNKRSSELEHKIYKRELTNYTEYDDQDEFGSDGYLEMLKNEFEPFITRSADPDDANNKALMRDYIIAKFNHLKMKTYKQPFQIVSTNSNSNSIKKGVNLFSYFPR